MEPHTCAFVETNVFGSINDAQKLIILLLKARFINSLHQCKPFCWHKK